MLFDLWEQTASRLHDHDALVPAAGGGRPLTFGGLHQLAQSGPRVGRGEIVPASIAGGLAPFIAQTLRAWRDGGVLLPFESQRPDVSLLNGLPARIAHVKTTSGSTGGARFVLFREEQLLADMQQICQTMGHDPAHPNLGVISAAHSYGFSHLVLPLLLTGMPLWHLENPLPQSMRSAFEHNEAFFLPAVPAMWRAWQQAGVLKGAPILRAMSAGAPLPLELERDAWADAALKIHNFYGASECGGIAYDDGEAPRTDAALVGRSLRGVSLTTSDEGCMIVSSPAVGECYWPPDDESAPLLRDGSFFTSDIAEIQDGAARLLGRVSDTINVAGRKIGPAEIEHALLRCGEVRHCVVFGVPSGDAARGEDIVACVNAAPHLAAADLSLFLHDRLAPWQMPRRWWLTSDLRPDERGKISRARWRSTFLSQPQL